MGVCVSVCVSSGRRVANFAMTAQVLSWVRTCAGWMETKSPEWTREGEEDVYVCMM